MALGQTIKDIQTLVDGVKQDFSALIKALEEVKASQKRIESVLASMLDKGAKK